MQKLHVVFKAGKTIYVVNTKVSQPFQSQTAFFDVDMFDLSFLDYIP